MSNLFNCFLPKREKVKIKKLKTGNFYLDITTEEACAIFRAYADGELVPKNELIGLSSDVAAVVRCKDCRWHEDEQPGMVYCPNIVGGWMENESFCSLGERE